ncbi:unnamed protein product [Thelazia callipaeda]|uniref:Mediator complex subunit 17 n=1 Tax=Thelazia callipaeda TaxID=103827 RepID=A0A0N5D6W3_THECL|nr:unnamed protein product [Thelazia callipaeda]
MTASTQRSLNQVHLDRNYIDQDHLDRDQLDFKEAIVDSIARAMKISVYTKFSKMTPKILTDKQTPTTITEEKTAEEQMSKFVVEKKMSIELLELSTKWKTSGGIARFVSKDEAMTA